VGAAYASEPPRRCRVAAARQEVPWRSCPAAGVWGYKCGHLCSVYRRRRAEVCRGACATGPGLDSSPIICGECAAMVVKSGHSLHRLRFSPVRRASPSTRCRPGRSTSSAARAAFHRQSSGSGAHSSTSALIASTPSISRVASHLLTRRISAVSGSAATPANTSASTTAWAQRFRTSASYTRPLRSVSSAFAEPSFRNQSAAMAAPLSSISSRAART
jgi:hypothetical protein